MSALLKHGQKVEYLYEGKWRKGIIHGVKTHETPDGQITRVAYLVDTGNKLKVSVDKRHKETGQFVFSHEEETDQPEQVEVEQTLVKLA